VEYDVQITTAQAVGSKIDNAPTPVMAGVSTVRESAVQSAPKHGTASCGDSQEPQTQGHRPSGTGGHRGPLRMTQVHFPQAVTSLVSRRQETSHHRLATLVAVVDRTARTAS
jgi:hypothetical protein